MHQKSADKLAFDLEQATSRKWDLKWFDLVGSTMDEARAVADQVTLERPMFILAGRQLAGRGRQGRVWHESERALLATLVFKTTLSIEECAAFPLVCACVLVDVVQSFGARVGVKWPNDVMSQDLRKIAGVLLESSIHQNQTALSIGIGVNLVRGPQAFADSVGLFELSGNEVTVFDFALPLGVGLWKAMQKFREEGFSSFRDNWLSKALFMGKNIKMQVGKNIISGKFVGINEHGHMLLDDAGIIHTIVSGHTVL